MSTSNTFTAGKRTVSPSQGEKRSRSDEDDGPSRNTRRNVSERSMESTKDSICELVVDELWSSDLPTLKKAMIQLLEDTNHDEEAKHLELQKEFFEVGGHLKIVKLMEDHLTCPAIQEYGVKILVSATYKNMELKKAIAKVGGIDATIEAMVENPKDRSITNSGLKALYNLSLYTPNAVRLGTNADGLKVIHHSLISYKQDYDVVLWACRALQHLSTIAELRKPMFEAKIGSAMFAIAEGHKTSKPIRELVANTVGVLAKYMNEEDEEE